jgi:hypothetical protein
MPAPIIAPPALGPGPDGRDRDFPALPYVPDSERCWWSEDALFKRHLLEIEENAKVFDRRLADGMAIVEVAALPTPWMNRHTHTERLPMRKRWPRNEEEER